MTAPSYKHRTVRLSALLASCAVLAATTSCSSQGRDYTIPKKFCHITMNPDVMAPTLPDGKSIEQKFRGTDLTSTSMPAICDLRVDKKDTIYANVSRSEKFLDPRDPIESYKFKNLEVVKGLPFDMTVLGDRSIVIDTKCNGPKTPRVRPYLAFYSGSEDTAQRRKDILAFGKAYTLALKKELGCTV
ncbi:hypothetical protein ACH4SP_33925 [Streptomyces sp. NPDC021093]|uniref:hypothetical protein n=1 Tax=Streptomyces sp. NPDC021093 TaxID=3365112 RepID=UPI003787E852